MSSLILQPILNAGQREYERRAIAIVETPMLRAACDDVAAAWSADPLCRSGLERAQVMPAVAKLAMISALDTVNDAAAPALIWCLAPPHSTGGLAVPASRFGVDNPDNVYRFGAVDGDSRYRLRGRFPGALPADFSVTALPFSFGDGKMGATVGFAGLDDVSIGADGSFEMLITPQGGPGGVACQGAVQICVRETYGNWLTAPAELAIERIGGPDLPRRSDAQLAAETARLLRARGKFLPAGLQRAIYMRCPVNEVIPPAKAGPLGGLITQVTALGHFDLAEDDALILSVDTLGSAYVGFQIADPWTVSYPYVDRFGSLNDVQAGRDADGRMTLVIAKHDPGFVNWIELFGGHSGSITFRWQRFPADAVFGPDSLRVAKVKANDVADRLAGKAPFLTAAERAQQREARVAAWSTRLTTNLA